MRTGFRAAIRYFILIIKISMTHIFTSHYTNTILTCVKIFIYIMLSLNGRTLSFEVRDFADRVAVVFDYNLATGRPAVINVISLFQFSSFDRKFGALWCEVFVDEDAVFDRASFVEVFETAPGTIHRVSTALAAEANNGGSWLCLAVDWAPESVSSFQVIACDWPSYVHFVDYNSYKFSSRFSPRISSPIPWMRRFGRLEYCCIESNSCSIVSTLFSRCTILSFLSDKCVERLANS